MKSKTKFCAKTAATPSMNANVSAPTAANKKHAPAVAATVVPPADSPRLLVVRGRWPRKD